ncbi:40s ribosomal protein s2, putative [Perkinsus marinus ATCC 50983]|uniref:40s ribosomal protein s2, putative n=1 Tax=Perkinsus marinus (strain ATCC 50983 / TXsc) TaxID=423536 RepID=C5LFT6_PERM5|nr:40s ribosomal protein s2, putative [Perkinsus marinus ATCC 50983]EER04407.1 40s ribosomal protein s2, putative [Perkinsus marinus ATCC 50983]|eukprot:XP_002772591.1 40s ribosomal protein s2, putative [Perkinsus marinus ATCC 50983]
MQLSSPYPCLRFRCCPSYPAPRGTHIVGAPASKKLIAFAGIKDCFTCSTGHTRTKGNFLKATFNALQATYGYLTPDLWMEQLPAQSPMQQWSDFLAASKGIKMQ